MATQGIPQEGCRDGGSPLAEIRRLDRELLAWGARVADADLFQFKEAGTPARDQIMAQVNELYRSAATLEPNLELDDKNFERLIDFLIYKPADENGDFGFRGTDENDDRRDFFQIENHHISDNAACVAAICMDQDLKPPRGKRGFLELRTRSFSRVFNLNKKEPFYNQPITAGLSCSGFLVDQDVVATAAHFANEHNVTNLRIMFGYKMKNKCTPITQVPGDDVYKGIKIIGRVDDSKGSDEDWALIKLDRKVKNRQPAILSCHSVSVGSPVYVMGHPVGLPLKYAAGAEVKSAGSINFKANLDVYSGNSGSPVFDAHTHQVIGMVVQGDNRDFRLTNNGWITVVYNDLEDITSRGAVCTRVSCFCKRLGNHHVCSS